jgi:ribonuclease P protein component
MGEAHLPAQQPQAGQATRLSPSHVDPRRAGDREGSAPQGSRPAVGLIWRVRDRSTFTALHRSGRRVRRGPITITWLPGDPAEPPRVAYAVGRKVGGAASRNRVRRRLRAITREVRPLLRPGAYLISAAPEVARLSYPDLRTTVTEALAAVPDTSP